MTENKIEVPFIPKEEISQRAEDFLHRYNPSDTIPVDIERIVEYDLGIEIIPVPGLKMAFNIDGWISKELKTITIDYNEYTSVENRFRFTVAHEVGHYILHKEIFEILEFGSVEEWKYNIINRFDSKKYGWLEKQADMFASMVLMPKWHVEEKFKEAAEKVTKQGFGIQFDSDLFNQYVSRWMAQLFNVSEQAMSIRLSKEKYIVNL
jgi:Zn-dependent peptidase ImmA (M78 family)